MTGRSRDREAASRTSKYASSQSTSISPRTVLMLGAVLGLLLMAIGVVYFVGFMGVLQVLYDTVEAVSGYWRGPATATTGGTQGAGKR